MPLNVDEVRATLFLQKKWRKKNYLQPFVFGKHMRYMS